MPTKLRIEKSLIIILYEYLEAKAIYLLHLQPKLKSQIMQILANNNDDEQSYG